MISKIRESDFPKGIDVFRWIAENNMGSWPTEILLNDGDLVAVKSSEAKGIIAITEALNPGNRRELESMNVMFLLHILNEALKARVLKLEELKLMPQHHQVDDNLGAIKKETSS